MEYQLLELDHHLLLVIMKIKDNLLLNLSNHYVDILLSCSCSTHNISDKSLYLLVLFTGNQKLGKTSLHCTNEKNLLANLHASIKFNIFIYHRRPPKNPLLLPYLFEYYVVFY